MGGDFAARGQKASVESRIGPVTLGAEPGGFTVGKHGDTLGAGEFQRAGDVESRVWLSEGVDSLTEERQPDGSVGIAAKGDVRAGFRRNQR